MSLGKSASPATKAVQTIAGQPEREAKHSRVEYEAWAFRHELFNHIRPSHSQQKDKADSPGEADYDRNGNAWRRSFCKSLENSL